MQDIDGKHILCPTDYKENGTNTQFAWNLLSNSGTCMCMSICVVLIFARFNYKFIFSKCLCELYIF